MYNDYFLSDIEGKLGNRDTKLLIVLKEPNTEQQLATTFWMRDGKNSKHYKRYYNVLFSIAKKLLNTKTKTDAFEQCAYCNLSPLRGNRNIDKGSDYTEILNQISSAKLCFDNNGENVDAKALQKIKTELNDNAILTQEQTKLIAKNRINLFYTALKNGVNILTMPEITQALEKLLPLEYGECYLTHPNKFVKYRFKANKANQAYIYCICHPQYLRINYKKLEAELGFEINTND